jgi:4-hydroxybenzoate polyprenyltransferase
MTSPLKLVRTYAGFVKLAHTVFALPFALAGMAAAYSVPADARGPAFSWATLGLVLLCMVGARSFAMAVNRIVDRRIDARNPRTAGRELPSGVLTPSQAWAFALVSAGVYFGACAMLGETVLILSPVPVAIMAFYPFTKRFTWLCHVVLGAALGLAPVGAWVAVLAPALGWAAVMEPGPWLLGAAVALWVAGFDIIYALQDDEFDREHRLHSIPARFGRRGALWISRGMHALSAVLFFAFVWVLMREGAQLAAWVWAAPAIMLAGMIYQHTLVKPHDLSRVNMAFFTVNGVISVVFGVVFLTAWLIA